MSLPESNIQRLERERKEKEDAMKKEMQLFSYEKIAEMTSFRTDIISVLHRTVAKGTTPSELAYFLNYCNSIELNPLNKEVWCYKDGQGNVIIFAGRDGFLKKAHQSKRYLGMRSSEVHQNDEFELDMIEGKLVHKFNNKDRGDIVGAYAIVKVEGREDTIKYVKMTEFDKKQANWKTMPSKMICKVAECHALKEAFGITGLAVEYDFVIKDNVAHVTVDADVEVIDKEDNRLLQIINAVKTRVDLEKHLKHCTTQELKSAYDKKYAELD